MIGLIADGFLGVLALGNVVEGHQMGRFPFPYDGAGGYLGYPRVIRPSPDLYLRGQISDQGYSKVHSLQVLRRLIQ